MKEKYTVPALARAFEILDMLSMSSIGMTKMEIARKLNIPYSTAFNLLSTLEQYNYVRKDEESGKYYLGLKLLSLGGTQMKDINLRDASSPYLEKLVRQTGITGHLAILDRGEAIYIDRKEPQGFIKINSWIGKRNYIHTSAVGKALAAYLPDKELQSCWGKGLPKRTAKTIGSFKQLKEEMVRVRERGYAIDDEEDEVGGRCIAAPIFDGTGSAIAAIGLSGIVSQLSEERLPEIAEMICNCAAQISARLGHRSSRPRE